MFKKLQLAHYAPLVLLITLSIIGVLPLLHTGLFTAHDIWHQVARLFHYSQSTLDGQFPPAWISNMANGYGYPLFIFSYHFPWLTGVPFVLLGLDVITTLKILFILPYILSGVTFFYMARYATRSTPAAVTGALLYLFAPYHFLSIYVSASIGSVYLFALIPLFFHGILHLFTGSKLCGIVLVSLSTSAMILTHMMSIAIFAPFLALLILTVVLANFEKITQTTRSIIALIFSAVLTIMLSLFYLVPLLQYLPLTQAVESTNGLVGLHKSNLVRFSQLLYSPWGFGPITENALNGEISFQVGIGQWLAIFSVVILIIFSALVSKFPRFKKNILFKPILHNLTMPMNKDSMMLSGLSISFLAVIWAMTVQALPFWNLFTEKIIAIDYPFRLLLLAVFIASLLGSYLVAAIKNAKLAWVLSFLFFLIALYTNRNHIRVNLYTDFDLDLYVRSEVTTNTFNEYAPKGTQGIISKEPTSLVEGTESISNSKRNTRETSFVVSTDKEKTITVNMFDFPGQTVYLNSHKVEHKRLDGKIGIEVPAGSTLVQIKYEKPTSMKLSLLTSYLTLLTMIIYYSYQLSKQRK